MGFVSYFPFLFASIPAPVLPNPEAPLSSTPFILLTSPIMPRSLVCICCMLLLAVQLAFGQAEQANVTGTVTDASKAIVGDAQVTVRNLATNVPTRTSTNSAGIFYIRALPPGS